MDKSKKIKVATKKTRKQNFKNICKKIITFPFRVCTAIWRWLKSIDVVGMVNLTLLVAIIVLFSSLIMNVLRCDGNVKAHAQKSNVAVVDSEYKNAKVLKKTGDEPRIINRSFNTALPLKPNPETGITPKVKVVGVAKPTVVKVTSLPANELPKQNLYGDVIVDVYPDSPVLSNGVEIEGNLFIQNMRKYTLPCNAKITGHLFVRNVDKLFFCGEFSVKGNIYVNRQSSFGPIPQTAHVGGQVIL